MSLTSIASVRPGSFVPAISHSTAAAAGATVTAQADGRFVVEPTRPDDSLFALLRSADACLGRPVERIGGMLSNIVGTLCNFGPTLAKAEPLPAVACDAEEGCAADTLFLDTATARAMQTVADFPIVSVYDSDGSGQSVGGYLGAATAAFDKAVGVADLPDAQEQLETTVANVRASLRSAIAEGPETARLIERMLNQTRHIVIVPSTSASHLRVSGLPVFYDHESRALITGHQFDGAGLAGFFVSAAREFAPQGQHQPPGRGDHHWCDGELRRIAKQAEVCVLEDPKSEPCREAAQWSRAVAGRTNLVSTLWAPSSGVLETATELRVPLYSAGQLGTVRYAVEHDAARAPGQGFGTYVRITAADFEPSEGTARPLTENEARMAHLYGILKPFLLDWGCAPGRSSQQPASYMLLVESVPLQRLAATCPGVLRLPD